MKAALATLLAQAEEKLRAAKLLLQGRAWGDLPGPTMLRSTR
jgi:hypothetical protein